MTNPRSFVIIDASNVIKYMFNDEVELREFTGTKKKLAKEHNMRLCVYVEGCDSMIAHVLTNMNISYCKPCKSIYGRARNQTEDGFFKMCYDSASHNAKARKGHNTLPLNWHRDAYLRRKYCDILNIPLFPRTGDWQPSINRLNNLNLNYEIGNVNLVCLEININEDKGIWTTELRDDLFANMMCPIGDVLSQVKSFLLYGPTQRGQNRKRKNNEKGELICYECGSAGTFNGQQIICKTCQSVEKHAYYQTFEGLLSELVGSCRQKDRDKYGGDEHTITKRWICEQLIAFMARCYYSGVPLVLVNGSAYTMSVERRNNAIGHIPSNCVLICRCFQSAPKKDLGHGTVQWSKAKWDYVVAWNSGLTPSWP